MYEVYCMMMNTYMKSFIAKRYKRQIPKNELTVSWDCQSKDLLVCKMSKLWDKSLRFYRQMFTKSVMHFPLNFNFQLHFSQINQNGYIAFCDETLLKIV